MKKKINLIFLALLLSLVNIEIFHAAATENKSRPEILKITISKVELCTGFQGGDFDDILSEAFCNDAIVLGEGDKIVDIASVDAGETAGTYGDTDLLVPLGETFTHVRVTFGKKFTMKGSSVVSTGSGSGDTNFCATKTTTDAMYGGGSGEAGKKYTHRVGVDPVGDINVATEEMNLYWVNGRKDTESGTTFTHCYGDNCGQDATNWFAPYLETATGAANTPVANSIPRASVVTDDMVNVYALSNPYTINTIPPTIDIAFSTSKALLVYEASKSAGDEQADGDGKCAFTVGDVFVKLTMKDSEDAGAPPPCPPRCKGDFK